LLKRNLPGWLAVACLAALLGCAGRPGPETTGAASRGDEAEFLRLAGEVPGFAGFRLRGDTVLLHLTEPRRGAQAESPVRRVVAQWYPQLEVAAIRVVPATFSFDQLARAHRRLLAAGLFGQTGVVAVGIDVEGNHVAVEVEDEEAVALVEQVVRRAGVPRGAVRIELSGPIVF
jgi:hypothetical protein